MTDKATPFAKVGIIGPAILIPREKTAKNPNKEVPAPAPIVPKSIYKRQLRKTSRANSGLDHLDFVLNSTYDNGNKFLFADKIDTVIQPETVAVAISKAIAKAKDDNIHRKEKMTMEEAIRAGASPLQFTKYGVSRYILRSTPERQHPIRYGGLKDHLNVNSVKLGISSNHVPQTINGFSRKVDGSFFHA